jgi:hypothetical protein
MESDLGCEKQKKLGDNEHLRAFAATRRLQSGKLPVAFGDTNEVLRRFDAETGWIAAGLVSFAIITALALAFDERREMAADHVTEDKVAGADGLLNANSSALPDVTIANAESASTEIPSGQTVSIDGSVSVISARQNPSPPMEPQESIQAPVSTLTSAVNQLDPQSNFDPVSSVHRQDNAGVILQKIHNSRCRHHSLARRRPARDWATLWSWRKGEIQKLVTLTKAQRTIQSTSHDALDAANQK